ncbi:MAG TPA: hypothetical protein PLP33_14510 [Leptospiraceae bacterium]|nr:hypothetical protein [Leptospiraceae bacterium]
MRKNYTIIRKIEIGQTYNLLTVIEMPIKTKKGYDVKVRCVCGTEKYVDKYNLIRANTTLKSCGCLKRGDKEANKLNRNIYNRWLGMIARCTNPKVKQFKDYGGRGISVCTEWYEFEKFKMWALLNGFSKELILDRKDPNANYCPENCRWITTFESGINKRNTIKIKAFGEEKTIPEWVMDYRCKVTESTLRSRFYLSLYKNWSFEDRISKAAVKREDRRSNTLFLTAFGETKSVHEWSLDSRCKVSKSKIKGRLQRNKAHPFWTNEQLLTMEHLPKNINTIKQLAKYGV